MTIEELDELCRLYMDCKLSVLEEKELEYVLSHTTLNSPAISDVKAVMGVQTLNVSHRKRAWNWRVLSGIAASVATIICLTVYFSSNRQDTTLITAYSHGRQLGEEEAIAASTIAMSKADSLMNYAAMIEREQLLKAEYIMNETTNN